MHFIPLTQLVAKYLSPEVDTTVAYTQIPAGFLYRSPLLTCENHSEILAYAEQYLKENPAAKKNTEVKLITTEKILIGSLALCTSTIFLKKSLQELTSEVKAIHYAASFFLASTLFYPFISSFTLPVIQLSFPEFSKNVADLRDFYDDVDTLSPKKQKIQVEAISYGIQQVRDRVTKDAENTLCQTIIEFVNNEKPQEILDCKDYPSTPSNTKEYIAIALGIIGIIHKINPFTMPKIPLNHLKTSRLQNVSLYLFNNFAYSLFSNSVLQVASSVFNT